MVHNRLEQSVGGTNQVTVHNHLQEASHRSAEYLNSRLFNVIRQVFMEWRARLSASRILNLTIADYFLKCGRTRLFDRFLEKVGYSVECLPILPSFQCVLESPRDFDMWLLAINRQRELGNIEGALRLAQKAYRFHKDRPILAKILKNLVAITAVITLEDVVSSIPAATVSASDEAFSQQ